MSAFVALVAAGLTVSTADAPVLGEAPLCGGDAEAGLGRFFEFPRDTSGGRSVRGAVVTAGAAIVDAAAAIALVAGAPTVSRADPDAPFGFVFSLTMAAASSSKAWRCLSNSLSWDLASSQSICAAIL